MRIPVLLLGLLMLSAASPPEPPPLPDILKPYVRDGRLVPGDFGYLMPLLRGGHPADDSAFAAFLKWQEACWAEAKSRVRADLQALGIAEPKIDNFAGAPLLCRMAAYTPFQSSAMTVAHFQELRQRVSPIAETYLVAVQQAKNFGGPRGGTLADSLIARPLGEQMLRIATSWGQGGMSDVPQLSPEELKFFQSRIGMEIAVLDQENTEWLKGVVAKQGWPKISVVGQRAANEAWLLAQHADHDPVFQLQMLRLMEPLLATGEVSKSNYAYLYDRIMLKLTGKQRYATQMTCQAGKRVPSPLEDDKTVDRLRAEMGMDPLAKYMKQMDELVGICPPA